MVNDARCGDLAQGELVDGKNGGIMSLAGAESAIVVRLLPPGATIMGMKVRDVIKAIELDGWRMEKRTATSHRKFSHPAKPGKVTLSGQLGEDVPTGTLQAIMKQTGLKP
jgi:predicted RNA binding protein YcfA (HicA-like mRNA interferase family)